MRRPESGTRSNRIRVQRNSGFGFETTPAVEKALQRERGDLLLRLMYLLQSQYFGMGSGVGLTAKKTHVYKLMHGTTICSILLAITCK